MEGAVFWEDLAVGLVECVVHAKDYDEEDCDEEEVNLRRPDGKGMSKGSC